MQIINEFKNSRIYDLNGDFEAIWSRSAWRKSEDPNKSKVDRAPRGMSPNFQENRKRTLQKAKTKIRRLIKRYGMNRFVTLTFAENIQNVKQADAEFRKFMKRVLRKFPEFKYIAVREFQERGAVHYHLAVTMFVKQDQLQALWGQGFVWVQRPVGNKQKLSNYLCKYLTKYSDDERLKSFHTYLASQGLKLPVDDHYFDSGDEFVEYLKKEHGSLMDNKQVQAFDDGQIIWVG